jgi:hypothetical protein
MDGTPATENEAFACRYESWKMGFLFVIAFAHAQYLTLYPEGGGVQVVEVMPSIAVARGVPGLQMNFLCCT